MILVRSAHNCAICGAPANVFRRTGAKTTWTRKGTAKAIFRATGRVPIVDGRQVFLAPTDWQQAEADACAWMKRNGYTDATLTRRGADGGIDIHCAKAVGQVKYHLKPVGIAEVQRLHGVALAAGKEALFFSRAGFTRAAVSLSTALENWLS